MRVRCGLALLLAVAATSAPRDLLAEGVQRLTVRDAVALALSRHPALATAADREAVAAAQVGVAKAEAAPRVGLVAQVNRSTGNAVPGATFGMVGVPNVAGPPAPESSASTWQTAAAVTAGWDVLELARRPTLIAAAERDVTAAKGQTDVTRLDVAAHTAEAFLSVAEAHALVDAAAANEKRAATFATVARTLSDQKLRPDLDLARAETELATARVGTERARLGLHVAAARFADALGEVGAPVEVVDDAFRALPPAVAGNPQATHPVVAAYTAAAQAAEARASVARLAYLPKVELLGAAWLRGGGNVLNGGPNSGSGDGIVPDTPNWAVGLVASWTPTDIPAAMARARVAAAEATALRAKGNEFGDSLTTDRDVARATLASARAVAQQTGVAVSVARRAHELAATRYQSALGNVVEVADADRALAAAERDDAVARVDAWRAFLALYRARGDLGPFLAATSGAGR